MDVRQLRYFTCIAELGSLSAASQRLGIAQPSLSHHVKHLEEELGVELLVRSSRGVSVTESGRILLGHAGRILKAIELAMADLRDRAEEPRGPVSIGLPSSACNVLSVPLAEAVRKQFPKVILRTMDAMSGHVQQWLTEGSIDVGILYDVNEVRHLRVTPLLVEELYLIVARDRWPHPVNDDGVSTVPVTLTECERCDLILPHRTHGLRETIERFVGERGVHINVVIEMDALSHLKSLVARGAGYSMLAPAAVIDEVKQRKLVLIPIRDALIRRTVFLVRNPLRVVSQAALEVERLTVNLVAELVRTGIWRGELVRPRRIRNDKTADRDALLNH
jgi:LysR family transcriptional regulator, nitrogen assimilation regulatory protein